ncbi:MAG TPA: methylmalonyl-CoA mutase family protein, partial [Planctomycetota bacterium]|nr:methylmalonyl-CoA mutase family protein [Planctomycetota bacterium]
VSGYHIREAGATAVQELAFTLADGQTYMRTLKAAGQDPNRVGRQMSFFFSVDNGFLEEIAKFRAARVLWAEWMRAEFQADDEACKLRFHSQVAGSTLTAQQSPNNAVRVALQALAAVLGGTQSLHTNSIDEALGLPTPETARLALRTQQIIAEETGVTEWVDPLGGSEAVESLTTRYITETRALWQRIDAEGGMLAAIEAGRIQAWIQESAYRTQREIDAKTRKIVGVNSYTIDNEPPPKVFRVDPALEQDAVERLRAHRAQRNAAAWAQALTALKTRAQSGENLLPVIVAAARAQATVGEICGALKEVFGEYRSASGLTA